MYCVSCHSRYNSHIYDVMGCYWNEPANYDKGWVYRSIKDLPCNFLRIADVSLCLPLHHSVWEQCDGTEGQWPGVYSGSTWYQGVKPTPAAQPAGQSSNCRAYPSISNGPAAKLPSKRASFATMVPRAAELEFDE